MKQNLSLLRTMLLWGCLYTGFSIQSFAQTAIFVKLSTSRTPVAATATINPPAGNSYSAAAPFAGTTWNVISQSNNLPVGTPAPWDTNLYTGLILKDASGNVTVQTLTVGYHAQTPNPSTRIEPSTGSGENTIQAGGVMQNAWRNFQTGNFSTWTISNLTANTKYGLYIYGGTTTSGQFAQITNGSPYGGINVSTTNSTLNSNGSAGSIWTVAGGTTNLMPKGTTWNFAVGQSDANGTFQFIHVGGGGVNEYLNGFQLVPLTAAALTGPTNQTVVAGNGTTLSATATGFPIPGLQWQTNGVNISGAASSSLVLPNVSFSQDGYIYSLVASNAVNVVTNSMTLTVIVTPGISGLNDQAVLVGTDVTMNPTVSGVPTPALAWQFNGNDITNGPTGNGSTISGSTTSLFTITNAQPADSGTYSLIASNSAGIVTNSMTLTVSAGNVPPNVTGPTDQTVVQGSNGTFTASVSGLPLPDLQWRENGVDLAGQTGSSLTLTNVQYAQNGFVYSLVASNTAGMATNSATLTVLVPPAITNQPVNLVVTNAQTATFTVGATGVPSPMYQWYFTNGPIAGATGATLTFTAAPTNIGSYFVVVTNLVGSTTSSVVTLTVNSTMSAISLSPTNGVTGVCYDTPLYLTFNQAPVLRNAGKIRIYNATNSFTPVETIDLSLNAPNGTQARNNFPGDSQTFNYYPVVITGSTAAIYPHAASGLLTSNQTYYVTVDNGVFADAAGAYFAGVTATNTWQFTTKAGGAADPVNPVVNLDGSGDFVTVQGAVDSLAANAGGLRRVITIKNGTYFEIVDIAGKTNVTLRGQGRAATIIKYPNNAIIASGGSTQGRMTFKVNANDVALENIWVTNSTPQGGGQAEALMINTSAKHCIVNNCEISSRQDTILANQNSSQVYFYNTKIAGNFDYIWGGGNLYFNQCVIHTISGTGSGNLTAARTDTSGALSAATPWVNPNGTTYSANGFSFVNCTLEADSGVTGITLAGNNGTAGGLDSWAFCKIDNNAYITPTITLSNSYVFWQFQNTDLAGVNPVSFANVQTIGVTNNDPRLLAATNIPTWFYGWTPQLAPNIVTQPTNRTANVSNAVSFTVSATGIPDANYQWFQGVSAIPGATNATFTIVNIQFSSAGSYSVVVSNAAGTVTSSNATLTVPDRPPVANAAIYTRPSGQPLNILISALATNWSDPDGDTISLTNGISSTNGAAVSYDSTWLHYTNVNDVADQINYLIGDGQGGTAGGLINLVLGPPPTNSISSVVANGNGTVLLNLTGAPNYFYQVEAATNLSSPVIWTPISTNVADGGGQWQFTDTQATNYPLRFYRSLYKP